MLYRSNVHFTPTMDAKHSQANKPSYRVLRLYLQVRMEIIVRNSFAELILELYRHVGILQKPTRFIPLTAKTLPINHTGTLIIYT